MKKVNNAEIKKYTTYRLGGKVSTIYFPDNVLELQNLLKELSEKRIKYKILGNGSNLIISSNYNGVLIKLENFDKLRIDGNIVEVEAGYMLPKLALECAKANLSGLEFASGIPATVGGAIYQNAGAYGMQMDKVIEKVIVLDDKGEIKQLSKEELKLGYRDSIFKHQRLICLKVFLKLKKDKYENIMKQINCNIQSRKEKQPLEYPSAGSVFRNPEGKSAGRLIEKAGLKGARIGDAMVSLKHANFIINVGHATVEDVLQLIKLVQDEVYRQTGILLEVEQELLE